MDKKNENLTYVQPFVFILGQQQCARIPDWMKYSGRIGRVIGGGDAPQPIPWQAGL